MLHTETVTAETLALIKRLMADEELKEFTLVGGTALALHIGHRTSIDIDLFSIKGFDTQGTGIYLSEKYKVEDMQILNNGIFCFIDDIKVDLIAHQYPIIKPLENIDGIRLMSLDDIAAMKIHAIVNSGQRIKDFVDIYAMLEHRPLEDLYSAYEEKYHPKSSRELAQRAILYHAEIDFNIRVDFLDRKFDWPSIEKRLKEAVVLPKIKFAKFRQSPGKRRGKGIS